MRVIIEVETDSRASIREAQQLLEKINTMLMARGATLRELDIPQWVMRLLERHSIYTVDDLCAKRSTELLDINQFGTGALRMVTAALAACDRELKS